MKKHLITQLPAGLHSMSFDDTSKKLGGEELIDWKNYQPIFRQKNHYLSNKTFKLDTLIALKDTATDQFFMLSEAHGQYVKINDPTVLKTLQNPQSEEPLPPHQNIGVVHQLREGNPARLDLYHLTLPNNTPIQAINNEVQTLSTKIAHVTPRHQDLGFHELSHHISLDLKYKKTGDPSIDYTRTPLIFKQGNRMIWHVNNENHTLQQGTFEKLPHHDNMTEEQLYNQAIHTLLEIRPNDDHVFKNILKQPAMMAQCFHYYPTKIIQERYDTLQLEAGPMIIEASKEKLSVSFLTYNLSVQRTTHGDYTLLVKDEGDSSVNELTLSPSVYKNLIEKIDEVIKTPEWVEKMSQDPEKLSEQLKKLILTKALEMKLIKPSSQLLIPSIASCSLDIDKAMNVNLTSLDVYSDPEISDLITLSPLQAVPSFIPNDSFTSIKYTLAHTPVSDPRHQQAVQRVMERSLFIAFKALEEPQLSRAELHAYANYMDYKNTRKEVNILLDRLSCEDLTDRPNLTQALLYLSSQLNTSPHALQQKIGHQLNHLLLNHGKINIKAIPPIDFSVPLFLQTNHNASTYGLTFKHPTLEDQQIDWGNYTPLLDSQHQVIALKDRQGKYYLLNTSNHYVNITDATLIDQLNTLAVNNHAIKVNPAIISSFPDHVALVTSEFKDNYYYQSCFTLRLPDNTAISANTEPAIKVQVNNIDREKISPIIPPKDPKAQRQELALSLDQIIAHQNSRTNPKQDYDRKAFYLDPQYGQLIKKSKTTTLEQDLDVFFKSYQVHPPALNQWKTLLLQKSGMQSQNFEALDVTIFANSLNTPTTPIPLTKIYRYSAEKKSLIIPTHTLFLNLGMNEKGKFEYLKTKKDGSMKRVLVDAIHYADFEQEVKSTLNSDDNMVNIDHDPARTIHQVVHKIALKHKIIQPGERLNIPYLGNLKLAINPQGKTKILDSSFYSNTPKLFHPALNLPPELLNKTMERKLKKALYTAPDKSLTQQTLNKLLIRSFSLALTVQESKSPLPPNAISKIAKRIPELNDKELTVNLEAFMAKDPFLKLVLPVSLDNTAKIPLVLGCLQQQLAKTADPCKQQFADYIAGTLTLALPHHDKMTTEQTIDNILLLAHIIEPLMNPDLSKVKYMYKTLHQLKDYGYKYNNNLNNQHLEHLPLLNKITHYDPKINSLIILQSKLKNSTNAQKKHLSDLISTLLKSYHPTLDTTAVKKAQKAITAALPRHSSNPTLRPHDKPIPQLVKLQESIQRLKSFSARIRGKRAKKAPQDENKSPNPLRRKSTPNNK